MPLIAATAAPRWIALGCGMALMAGADFDMLLAAHRAGASPLLFLLPALAGGFGIRLVVFDGSRAC